MTRLEEIKERYPRGAVSIKAMSYTQPRQDIHWLIAEVEASQQNLKDAKEHVASLKAEVERLKGLIKTADERNSFCSWCDYELKTFHGEGESRKHHDNCPAFAPEGEVK